MVRKANVQRFGLVRTKLYSVDDFCTINATCPVHTVGQFDGWRLFDTYFVLLYKFTDLVLLS